jgi:HK97 family phage portal protein
VTANGVAARIKHREAMQHLEAYGGSEAIDHVMDCVDLYATTVSSAPYHFERDGGELIRERNDKTPKDAQLAPPDLVSVITWPNPWQDWTEFIELCVIDFLLVGNAFWLKVNPTVDDGKPASLVRLDPRKVTVVQGETKMIDHYEYDDGSSQPKRYKAEHVIHFRRPSPHRGGILGVGFIAGAPRMFDIELAMTESMASYYEQGMRASGVLETDRNVPGPLMDKIKRQFAGLYAGARNSYKVPVLERGLKFRPVSANAADAEFSKLGPLSQKRIAALFKVPLPMLGVYDNADRQAVREAQRIFDNKVMIPFLNRFARVITRGLTLAWEADFVFDYEYEMPIEDRMELGEKMAVMPGIRVRELREQIGLPPLGPEEKGPDGKPIDEIILNLPGDDENDSDVKDQPIGSEPGRPPNPENTRKFPTDAEVVSP